jgi:Leucine-rich repeat (LRR) protein
VSLPERLGELKTLQRLDLRECTGLLSLPERLGELKTLQRLNLRECTGLLSLPDLSGLAQLEVESLPNHLQPWKASGYKAFSYAAWLDTQIDEGTLTELRCPASLTSLPERLGELQTLQTLDLTWCTGLVSLPERLGELKTLQTLDLQYCTGLVSLPERLGELKTLQTLNLLECTGLVSLPDLSGLAQLEVKYLPDHLQPWKASGYKAFSYAAWLDTQIDEGTLSRLRCPTSLTSLPERLGELKTLQTLNLRGCRGLVSLPERLGELKALQTLDLQYCSGLLSLPERLGELKTLQSLNLLRCTGLVSLPDLSGLVQLKVKSLPDHLQPWKASGYKAFSLTNEA